MLSIISMLSTELPSDRASYSAKPIMKRNGKKKVAGEISIMMEDSNSIDAFNESLSLRGFCNTKV